VSHNAKLWKKQLQPLTLSQAFQQVVITAGYLRQGKAAAPLALTE
jgi:hypothetical protein